MALRTKESLNKLFQASRTRQERLKKLHDQQPKLKRNTKQVREKVMQNLQLLLKPKPTETPIPEEKTKEPKIPRQYYRTYQVYNTTDHERNINEEVLYTTREELMEAEERGEGKINWEMWDKVSQETQQRLKELNLMD